MSSAHTGAPPAIVQKRLEAGPVTAGGVLALCHFARRALMAVPERLVAWQERARHRHHLSMIDTHGLRDVGLTCADLEPEIRKPFWRS